MRTLMIVTVIFNTRHAVVQETEEAHSMACV